jgi:probable lipoprotein NlpC
MCWSEQYLGLPYLTQGRSTEGLDCWGLAYVVLNAFGRPVASYAGQYASEAERGEIAGLIGGAKSDWKQVQLAQEFDLVTFRRGQLDGHVGIVVRAGLMLHITKGKLSCIERYDAGYWANRLTGIWRHVAN